MHEIGHDIRLFNTAVIATKITKSNDAAGSSCAGKLQALTKSPAFAAIMKTIHEYANERGLSEDAASEEIIRTFRDIDEVWNEYIYQEGLDRLRGQLLGKKDN